MSVNPFNLLNSGDEHERFEVSQNRAWEGGLVRHVMTRCGLGRHIRAFQAAHQQQFGFRDLTFAAFNTEFHTFPVFLGCSRLRHIPVSLHCFKGAILPLWFKTFLKLPFMPPYMELHNSFGESAKLKPIGLVFPRKGFQKGLVVHNGEFHMFVPPQSSVHVYHGGGRKPLDLIVQPFSSFLDHIYRHGHGWKFED